MVSFQGMLGTLVRWIDDKRYHISAMPLNFRSSSSELHFGIYHGDKER